MKKINRKLTLHIQTLRTLVDDDLGRVGGGTAYPTMGPDCESRRPPCECDCGDSRISGGGGGPTDPPWY